MQNSQILSLHPSVIAVRQKSLPPPLATSAGAAGSRAQVRKADTGKPVTAEGVAAGSRSAGCSESHR